MSISLNMWNKLIIIIFIVENAEYVFNSVVVKGGVPLFLPSYPKFTPVQVRNEKGEIFYELI